MTRWQRWATVGSCVTMMIVRPVVDQLVEQLEDLLAGLAVERAGRLVGQQDQRVVDQRPRDADALLLPAGELHRAVVERARPRPTFSASSIARRRRSAGGCRGRTSALRGSPAP